LPAALVRTVEMGRKRDCEGGEGQGGRRRRRGKQRRRRRRRRRKRRKRPPGGGHGFCAMRSPL